MIARGAGRSYGDAAQNEGGDVLDMTALNRVLSIDRERASITAQAGATIAQMMASLAPHNLTLPVVPGTRHVTLAGAIASDIHGKNHHRDGGFARHVDTLTLCTPGGDCREVSPETDPELFYATLGGMGLTGVVVEATLRAEPLAAPWVLANTDRTDSFERDTRGDGRRGAPSLLGGLAGPAGRGLQARASRDQPCRPVARAR